VWKRISSSVMAYLRPGKCTSVRKAASSLRSRMGTQGPVPEAGENFGLFVVVIRQGQRARQLLFVAPTLKHTAVTPGSLQK